MEPQLVIQERPYAATTLLDPPGARQVHRRSGQGLSRKTGEETQEAFGQTEGAESLKGLRPF
jgi:hypothetical protein